MKKQVGSGTGTFPDNSISALRLARIVVDRVVNAQLSGAANTEQQLRRLELELKILVEHRGSQWAEDELQALLVAALASDILAPYVIAWHHSPMGFDRSQVQAYQAKRAGATAGWPDLQLLLRSKNGAAKQVFLELKTETGALSKIQKTMHESLRLAGLSIVTCHGLSATIDALVDVLCENPLKTVYKRRTE